MFIALLKRQHKQYENAFFPTACLMAMYANAHRDPKKSKAFSPEDFMPGHSRVKKVSVAQFAQLVQSGAYGQ